MADPKDKVANDVQNLITQLGAPLPTGSFDPIVFDAVIRTVDRLTKLVHILWKEVERLESAIRVTGDEVDIKIGAASLVLNKGGSIALKGRNIKIDALNDLALTAGGQFDATGGNMRVQATRTFSVNCGGDSTIKAGGDLTVKGVTKLFLESSGPVLLRGSRIVQN